MGTRIVTIVNLDSGEVHRLNSYPDALEFKWARGGSGS